MTIGYSNPNQQVNYSNVVNPSAPSIYPSTQYSAPPPQDQPPAYNNGPTAGQKFSNLRSLGTAQDRQFADQNREQRYTHLLRQYEISHDFSTRLQKNLNMTKIVYVYDDSGSMNMMLNDSPLNTGVFKATRWDELKHFSKVSIELANVFNPEGIDIFFLNRPAARAVKHIHDLEPYFIDKPNGFTPIRRVLQTVLAENNRTRLAERKLLIVIVTDGEPTDEYGKKDIKGFKEVLQSRDRNVHTTIVSCTDEEHTMDYLNNWDRNIPRLDVIDDYKNERNEILRAKGKNFPFSYGDYIVKSLIGSIDQELDNFDENTDCSCSIV